MIRPRSLVAAFVLLALLGLVLRDDPRKLGATSFGYVPSGHRAVFELFVSLGWPVARSYGPPDLLPAHSSVWWIEPQGLCGGSSREDDADAPHPAAGAALVAFVERGGTAVVALTARPSPFGGSSRRCEALGDLALPSRDLPGWALEEGEDEDVVFDPLLPHARGVVLTQWVEGDLGGSPRELELPQLAAFLDVPEWEWRVRARVDGRALLLEREIGQGRLALVSDATFLRNGWLDVADAAPLAVDLARVYGFDTLDERAHGLRYDDQDALAFLATSPAAFLFFGLALLGALVFWWGSARPAPLPGVPSAAAPTLEGFVASLAALYGRSRDYTRLAERYRELSVARLRRHFGLPSDTRADSVLTRLRRQGRLEESALSALEVPARAGSAGELARQVRRFDAIVEEGSR